MPHPVAKLSIRHQRFLELYTSDPIVKYNATDCYMKLWPKASRHVAQSASSQLLKDPVVAAALQAMHANAESAAEKRLKIWKEEALAAQQVILDVRDRKNLPMKGEFSYKGTHLQDVHDTQTTKLQLEAAKFIIERAYPAALNKMFEKISKVLDEEEERAKKTPVE